MRRGLESEEQELLEWLSVEGIPSKLVLTKSDKLRKAELVPRVQAVTHELALPSEDVAAVSARTGQGLGHVAAWFESWTGLALRRPDGTAHHS